MDTTQQHLLHVIGIADAMAVHCRDTAGKLADKALEGEKTVMYRMGQLRKKITAAGVGTDHESEDEYTHLVTERRRLSQAYELAKQDAARAGDLPAKVVKKAIRTTPVPVAIHAAELETPGIYQSAGDLAAPAAVRPAIPEWIMNELLAHYSPAEIEFARLLLDCQFDAADEMAEETAFPEEFMARGMFAANDLCDLLEKTPPAADRPDALVDVTRTLYGPHAAISKGKGEFVPPDVPIYRIGRPTKDSYLPLNGVENRRKYNEMVEAMRAGNFEWRVPLIRCGDQLVTGSHRFAACRETGTPVETKTLDEVFAECGLSLRELWTRHAQPFDGWLSNLDYCIQQLPQEVRDHYGIDLG